MSKSKGNLVGAIDMADKYGCDTGRMYTLFAAPPEKDLEWSEQGIEGSSRFLSRVFRLVDKHAARVREIPIDWNALTDFVPRHGEGKSAHSADAPDAEARDERFRGAVALQYLGRVDHGARQ